VSDDRTALVIATFFEDREAIEVSPQAYDPVVQDALPARCLVLCDASLPEG
jgi:hypothetical protein